MSSVVITIHTFIDSCAGFPASDNQSCSCNPFFLLGRQTRTRNPRPLNAIHYRDLWQQATEICGGEEALVLDLQRHNSTRRFVQNRKNSNFNFNEVIL
jgi:hypothetical protein